MWNTNNTMPNKRNALKALRQTKKRATRNLARKDAFKKAVKTANKAIEAGKKDLKELARMAQKTLDKAAKAGVIKKRTAARKLSRLMKKANKVK